MNLIAKCLVWCAVVAILSSCGEPEASTPASTPFSLHVTYPANLKPWIGNISDCASATSGMAVYFTQSPATVTANFSDQLHLELGEPAEIDPTSYLAHVGYEEIVLIANQLNPLDELTLEELQGIYGGKESRWNQGSDQPIQVWVLPVGDTARQVFDSAVIPSQSISPNALLAPDAGAMLEAVAGDEYAIGYLPASFITSSDPSLSARIKLIKIDNLPAERFTLPVIAVTDGEPEGLTRQLIICLQEATP